MSKICNICKEDKLLDNYNKNNRNKDKLDNKCKECIKKYNSERKEQLAKSQRKWREKNPNYMKEYGKSEKIIEYQKKYYEENKDIYKNRKKEWRKNNPERENEARQNYRINNIEKLNEYHRNWKKEQRLLNPMYKLKENTSRRIRKGLNDLLNNKKSKRTIDYTGCSMEELKVFLENKFNKEMSWENYGKYWHIDHIIPVASWDLENKFENFCCWNYRNLQPLESKENQSKKDKYNLLQKEEYINRMKEIYEK